MKIVYATKKFENVCKDRKIAKKFFDGNEQMVISLMARINALKQADTLNDIIVQPTFHFHKLLNKNGKNLEGYYAIDVKSRKDKWRIILEPLDEDEKSFESKNIDEISKKVRIIEITEVSKHYE